MTIAVSQTSPSATPLLRLSRAGHCFKTQTGQIVQALTEINLQVYPGDRIALIGPSGAGKSTLLRLLNGSLFASQGEVWAFDRNLAQASTRQRRKLQRQIGTIYQQFNLIHPLRVIHNVNAGQLGRWSWPKAIWSLAFPQGIPEAETALAQVGIAEKIFVRTDQLSGGQQQRVAIARVLVQNPLVILADEPIASLDPERSREIMELLTQLCPKQRGNSQLENPKLEPGSAPSEHRTASNRALVVSLHDLEMARAFCDRIVGLRQGKILFDLPTSELDPTQVESLYRIED